MALSIVPSLLESITDRVGLRRYLTILRGEIETRLAALEGNTIQKATLSLAYNNAALVAASSNGASASVNLGSALPANARVLAVTVKLTTPFTGGSASAVTLDVGTSGDDNALVAGADLFAAAVDGQASSAPSGIAPRRHYATSTQLVAKVTPDAGHKLSQLTAGAAVIDVLYTVLA